jgi:hypothetical protein
MEDFCLPASVLGPAQYCELARLISTRDGDDILCFLFRLFVPSGRIDGAWVKVGCASKVGSWGRVFSWNRQRTALPHMCKP